MHWRTRSIPFRTSSGGRGETDDVVVAGRERVGLVLDILMIVGFTMLLGLSVYLTMFLVHVKPTEPPNEEVADRRPLSVRAHERIAS
jgi:hypothetical protein